MTSTDEDYGHAPGNVRGPFLDALDACYGPGSTPTVSGYQELRRSAAALGKCTDTLPRDYCELLDIPSGSTYAKAAAAVTLSRLLKMYAADDRTWRLAQASRLLRAFEEGQPLRELLDEHGKIVPERVDIIAASVRRLARPDR
jgi:hypothetical protein